jgi:uncharacterized protein
MKNIPVRTILLILVTLFLINKITNAQDEIPEKPNPPRLVNDFAGILSQDDIIRLEHKVVAINDSTSTQIAVVIVNSLGGYDPSDYAQRLGQKWGVGGSKFDNGFVILVKPKQGNEKGRAFIATGYGVEGVVPDATAWDIVNKEMIPHFRQNDYFGGIDAAVNTIVKFTSGEFKASTYGKKSPVKEGGIIFAIVLFIIAFLIITRGRNHRNISRSSSSSILLWPFLFGGSGGGNWGDFSGGRGGFGGGGGFGGFGGGSFGGGGAGGSW